MKIYSATLNGVKPVIVEVEIDLSKGLPFFQIVGLPDEVLKESKTRVKSAILQSGFEFPYDRRVVLNLAPSQLKKEGSAFELALASKIIFESGQGILPPYKNILMLGELGLDGGVKLVDEIETLIFSIYLNNQKPDLIVIPNIETLSFARPLPCSAVCISSLQNLCNPNWWEQSILQCSNLITSSVKKIQQKEGKSELLNLSVSEFWAQHLKIATVGRHHYLLCGPPGCGKTFFAEALKVIKQSLTKINQSPDIEVLHLYFNRASYELPWAAPHHTATSVGVVGGGNPPKPGAITKAHGGILFLDELLEFSPRTLDSLREPLERGVVEVCRAGQSVVFPSQFQLIGATNPCKCGYWRHPNKPCKCTVFLQQRYVQKLSGPLMDRFDVKLFCKPLYGNEKKISLAKVISEIKEILDFKNKNPSLHLNSDAEALLNSDSICSMRQRIKAKNLAITLALLGKREVVDFEHVEKALEYQTIRELLD